VISGTVVANEGPVVRLVVRDRRGRPHAIDAVVDTGFTDWLTLRRDVIAELDLSYHEQAIAVLADGDSRALCSYRAAIIWDGKPEDVIVDELESEPLIGMRLLKGFRFTMNAVDGGMV